jgi:uncharacterized protein YbjT (DUF2867 family)
MHVVVIGGHGKVARRLLQLLAERGDRATGIIRNPNQVADLGDVGAEAIVGDIEAMDDISELVAGADAVVFAAGAGAGSGPERKRTVDYGGAIKLIEACRKAAIDRYLMISAMGVRNPAARSEQMRPYYEAKLEADQALMASGLDWTIVRPGMLTDDPGTGLIAVADELERGAIPREDVAATLLACLDEPGTAEIAFDVVSGDTPIAEAITALAGASR